MINLKNFTKYKPEDPEKQEIENSIKAIFLQSEDGQDWYECQKSFSELTSKVMYDSGGVIRAITHDISSLYPEGKSVAEVEELPESVSIDGQWIFQDGQVLPKTLTDAERQLVESKKKTEYLQLADWHINTLSDAVEFGMATETEATLLIEWRKYRVLINRIDTTDPDSIVWPPQPQ